MADLIHIPVVITATYIGIGVLLLLVIVLMIKKVQKWPYQAVPVMSAVEKRFYTSLLKAFPEYHILAQVQLCRVIRPPRNRHEYRWLNKIWRMSLDYVILDKYFNTLVVIELDDRSHLSQKRKEADERKNKALKAAGVRLIRVQVNNIPSVNELVRLVNQC